MSSYEPSIEVEEGVLNKDQSIESLDDLIRIDDLVTLPMDKEPEAVKTADSMFASPTGRRRIISM